MARTNASALLTRYRNILLESMVKFIPFLRENDLSLTHGNHYQDSIETATVQLRENVERTRNHLDFMAITRQNSCINFLSHLVRTRWPMGTNRSCYGPRRINIGARASWSSLEA